MLTERRADVLSMLVNAYIVTAAPVSSRALVDRNRLPLSSATVRNELAALEEEGYVTHPYTSSGRIPSDRGYRVYVESLMDEQPVAAGERRTVEHQFHQAAAGLDEWLSLAASVLAAWVGNAVVVSRPRPRSRVTRLRHVQLVELREDAALLVAVLDDGRVAQRMLNLERTASQDQLSERARRLNAAAAGSDATALLALVDELEDEEERRIVEAVAGLLGEAGAGDSYLDGLEAVLEQPEFTEPGRMLEAVRHLAAYELRGLMASATEVEPGGTRVVIGGENEDPRLHDWSVILSAYGERSGPVGTVAVLGPTRMDYARTIPRVRYLASLMGNLVHEVAP